MARNHRHAVAKPPRMREHPIAVEMPGARSVIITGSFCGWSREGRPMHERNGGLWATTLTLPPGRYEYRLLVDGEWRDDPNCEDRMPNPFGSENCVFEV
jgi:1,4-alpha-glucan branching enzyme